MDTTKLKKWCTDNKIEDITIKSFWEYYYNYREEDREDFDDAFYCIDERLINVKLEKIQLTHIFDYNDFIYSILGIYYLQDYIGSYKLVFDIEGEIEDDILRLESSNHIKVLAFETERSIEIAKNCLRKNMDNNLISNITELDVNFIEELRREL